MPTPSEHTRDLMAALRRCLPVRKAAPRDLEQLAETLMQVPLRSLASVDELLRSSSFGWTDGWYELAVADVARVAASPHSWAFLALAASHRIGFVRQAALRELAQASDGRAVPFVVLRLNDWVAEVRRAAQAALASYVSPAFAPSLVATLPLIFALEGRRRSDHSTVVAWIVDLMPPPPPWRPAVVRRSVSYRDRLLRWIDSGTR